jgi:hypothetical protein
MVCHGGSGTVLGGLAACIPQVVVPFGADQPLNAQSIAAVGAGLALNKPDAPTLRAAIERVLADSRFRDAARVVSRETFALPSVDEAANALLALAGPLVRVRDRTAEQLRQQLIRTPEKHLAERRVSGRHGLKVDIHRACADVFGGAHEIRGWRYGS